MEFTKQEEINNRQMLLFDKVLGFTGTASFIVVLFISCFLIEENVWHIVSIIVGFAILMVDVVVCLKIEHDAGYYECPYCEQKGYHKKVLTK